MKTYRPLAGETIDKCARRMVELANSTGKKVVADFNDIKLSAKPGDKAQSIVEYYWQESRRRHEVWKRSPEGQAAERRAKEHQRTLEEEAKKSLPSFSLKDPAGWQKTVEANRDFYGSGVVRYAARWAALMEKRIAAGARLEDIAKETSHEADIEGITGFMYGAAVSILSQVWEYGETLRRWHNLDTQIGNEGERANENGVVLNPAILRIVKK